MSSSASPISDSDSLSQFQYWMDHKMPAMKAVTKVVYDQMFPYMTKECLRSIVQSYGRAYNSVRDDIRTDIKRARTDKRKEILEKKLNKAEFIFQLVSSSSLKNGIVSHVKVAMGI